MQFGLRLMQKIMAFFSKTSTVGIVETSEALVGLNEISLFLIQRFREGYGTGNFAKIWDDLQNDPVLKAKVAAAYSNYALIPDEMKDLDAGELMTLSNIQMDYVRKLADAFAAPVK